MSDRSSTRSSTRGSSRASSPSAIVRQSYTGPAGEPMRPFGAAPPRQSYTGPAGLVRPAGAEPLANYPAGRTTFNTTLQAIGAEPVINTGAFLSTLQRTVREIMGPGVTVEFAQIIKGGRTTQSIPRRGVGRLVPGLNLVNEDVAAYWISINEIRVNATQPYTLNGTDARGEGNGLNRAIARAVAQVTTWRNVESGFTAPTNGGSLDAMFRTRNACSGGHDYSQVWAAACTRPVAGSFVPAPTSSAPVTPVITSVPAPSPGMASPGTDQILATGQTCAVRLQAASHMRATATFDIGSSPSFRAGTAVTVTGPYVAQRGSLTLYPVSVAGQAGFMPLSQAEMAPCATFPAPAPRSSSSGGGGGSSSSTSRYPVAVRTSPSQPPNTLASLSGDRSSASSILLWGSLAAVATFGLVAVVIKRKEIKRALSGSKRKRNRAKHSFGH